MKKELLLHRLMVVHLSEYKTGNLCLIAIF
jgi:hypothetical protein